MAEFTLEQKRDRKEKYHADNLKKNVGIIEQLNCKYTVCVAGTFTLESRLCEKVVIYPKSDQIWWIKDGARKQTTMNLHRHIVALGCDN